MYLKAPYFELVFNVAQNYVLWSGLDRNRKESARKSPWMQEWLDYTSVSPWPWGGNTREVLYCSNTGLAFIPRHLHYTCIQLVINKLSAFSWNVPECSWPFLVARPRAAGEGDGGGAVSTNECRVHLLPPPLTCNKVQHLFTSTTKFVLKHINNQL